MRTFRAWAYLAGFEEYNSRNHPSGKDRHSCMRDERIRRDTCSYLPKLFSQNTEFCHERAMSRSRPQFPRSTHGTPGTMTPLLARKSVAFSDLGFPYTEARVIIAKLMFETRQIFLGTIKISFKACLILVLIILNPLIQRAFTYKVLDSQFKWTRFLESEQKRKASVLK